VARPARTMRKIFLFEISNLKFVILHDFASHDLAFSSPSFPLFSSVKSVFISVHPWLRFLVATAQTIQH
jgi:hypothetical protein